MNKKRVFILSLFFNPNRILLIMSRFVTLFTGQWADLTLPELAKKASEMGYDGLEWPAGETILMSIKRPFPKSIARSVGRFSLTMGLPLLPYPAT